MKESKYINLVLADLLERATTYAKRSVDRKLSPRERAVAKALALEIGKAYNIALVSLGPFGSSRIAQEQKPFFHQAIVFPSQSSVSIMTEEEFQELITKTFGVPAKDRAEYKATLNKALAQVSVAYPDSLKYKDVRDAIQALVDRGLWDKFAGEIVKQSIDSPIAPVALPRGNPMKGSLVAKYQRLGYGNKEANAAAELKLSRPDSGSQATVCPSPTRIIQDDLVAKDGTVTYRTTIVEEKEPSQEDVLAILEGE